MKKLLILFLLIAVTKAYANPTPQVDEYKIFLATLDKYSTDSIKLAEQKLKTSYKDLDIETKDLLFAEFLEFYSTYIKTLKDHVSQETGFIQCGEDGDTPDKCTQGLAALKKQHNLSILVGDNPGRHVNPEIEKELNKYSITTDTCEEFYYIKEKGSYILNSFKDFSSPALKQFLKLRDLEINNSISPACEAIPDHKPTQTEYQKRKNALDLFIKDNSNFKLTSNAKQYREIYRNTYAEYLETINSQ